MIQRGQFTLSGNNGGYAPARNELLAYLRTEGFTTHPNEVFCPGEGHCWVDVAALKGRDYWAFEYKSRNDSIRRGFEQCCAYARGFNYVVLVADRHRVTSSPYFARLKRQGFGVWRHDQSAFQPIIHPKRHATITQVNRVVERQFKRVIRSTSAEQDSSLTSWLGGSAES